MGREGLTVRWTRPALADFGDAQDYIAKENPEAARGVADRIWDSVQHLGSNPYVGREGHVPGTREWVITGTQYLVVYRVNGGDVEILSLWHGRRNWQGA